AARVWFDELPPESIDGYKDMKAAFLSYFMQQKKYVKDPVEIHNIKQRDGENLKDFMERFKIETGRMKGAPECMRISGFMHGINNPELTKCLNEHVPRTMEEMMVATTAFIREPRPLTRKKATSPGSHRTNQRNIRTKGLTFEVTQGTPPPPMVTPVEKRNGNKFCDFHNDKGHSTDECMQLKKQIEELVRAGKLSHLIKEIKQGREEPKTGRKEVAAKDKPMTIYMVRSWQRTVKQKITQSFEQGKEITFPPLANSHGTEGPLVIEAEVGGHTIHRMYIDDIFAWQPSDMTGVPRSMAEHRLNVREGCPPIRQKKRGQAPERTKAIQAEVEKLVEAGIIREVYYHDWLSNPVMVKKHDGSWRIYPFKCFLDAYKGCHQIQMAAADEEKTAFHTGQGVYCYTKMPFGLKNAGATYQRLMDKAFENQMGRNIQVYVDDLVVKSHTETEMTPVYFIRRALQGPELNYSPMEKLVLSLVFAVKRLRRYFQAHPIAVITDQPIKQVMSRPDAAGRLQKWSIMLGEHYITYRPRTSIKGQILADFLNEMPSNASQGASVVETQEEPWTLFTDGSSCVDGLGAGLILTNLDGVEFTYALRF
nr:reverse transcriptase domain-containing protein [Tanacetum cinerariifolium]